jgi:hypothetical protein
MSETSDSIDDELRLGELDVVPAVQGDPMVWAGTAAEPHAFSHLGPRNHGVLLHLTKRAGAR